jgi:hypothetical protein
MKVLYAFVLSAALCFAGGTLADDVVKSGGGGDKPGRTVDDGTVKSGGGGDKPGRTMERDGTPDMEKKKKSTN